MPAAPDPTRLAGHAVTDAGTIARWRDLLYRAAATL
jgi:O-succinylbenzoate synthase